MFKKDNKWYFENEDGSRIVSDWVKDNDKWYYIGSDGYMTTGWINLDGKWYYLNPCEYSAETGLNNGQMLTGWVEVDNKWFYLNPKDYEGSTGLSKGEMLTGWIKLNDTWYYLNPKDYESSTGLSKGQMLASTSSVINGKSYSFNLDGAMINNSITLINGSYISDDCLCFIKGWEGFTNDGRKYYDCVGVLTQGYGMTGDEIVNLPDQISEEIASSMLNTLVNNKYVAPVKVDLDKKGISLTQNQFDALVTFAYNCGTPALFESTLYRNVCNGIIDANTIIDNFRSWSHGETEEGWVVIPGLLKRRNAEAEIFINGDYSARP